jgi:ATP-dependent DNA helicase RecG
MANIDLMELSARESERVEWKENVANIDQLIKTIVAFANDISNLGGGYVVCGAREGQDQHGFQQVILTGLTSSRIKEIEGKVLRDCRTKVSPPIIPVTEEIPVKEDRRILVFIVPCTGNAHSFRAGKKDSSTYFIRVGRETLEARNGLLTELLIKKNRLEPWDHRINKSSAIQDIDLVALREYLQAMKLWSDKKTIDDYLSPGESISSFVPSLTDRVELTAGIHPRNFALIMFGRDPMRFFRGAYIIYSIYPGIDRSEPTSKRHEVTGTVVRQAHRLIEMLEAETSTIFDKTSDTPNVTKYPLRALQEAVINALVHRDYESYQPIRITAFRNRMEINSPGALPRTVEKEQFLAGRAAPYWKNQALAYFFNKLQLAQGEGQGIPTIYRSMKENGNPAPIFEFGPEHVICTLPAHPRHDKV